MSSHASQHEDDKGTSNVARKGSGRDGGGGAVAVVSWWPKGGGGALTLLDHNTSPLIVRRKDGKASPRGLQREDVELKAKTGAKVVGIYGGGGAAVRMP